MLRCINCHLSVKWMLRHAVSSLESTIQTLLSTWKSLQQLPPEAVICQNCFLRLNEHCGNGNMNAAREFGHSHVCVGCGKSVLETRRRVRYHTVEANHPLVAIILSWDTNNEVISGDALVCHLCWMHASRLSLHDTLRVQPSTDQQAEIDHTQVDQEQLVALQHTIPTPPPPPPPPPPSPSQEHQVSTVPTDGFIILPHYKRVANTSRHCIFQGCVNQSGHLIPLLIKVMLLKQNHIYVPVYSRVCETHLYATEWSELNNNSNLTRSFTAHQIEDLIRILERNAELFDFENVHEMPNHICHYWTGKTVLEFLTLFNEIPILKKVSKGRTCLAIHLTKLRTDDSDNRSSTINTMPHSTLVLFEKNKKLFYEPFCYS